MDDPLRHHGDVEVGDLLDLAVNVYAGPRPAWLDAALRASLGGIDAYPSSAKARAAVAEQHQRPEDEVLVTRARAGTEPKIPSYAGGKFPLSTFLAQRLRGLGRNGIEVDVGVPVLDFRCVHALTLSHRTARQTEPSAVPRCEHAC